MDCIETRSPRAGSDPLLQVYDATEYLESVRDEAWEFVSLTIDAHPSQQDALFSRALAEAAPAHLRRLYFVDAARVVPNPAYAGLCP